jgi:hypothetical protein
MPLPKQLSAWSNLLKETIDKGHAKYGKNKDGKWVYTLKRGMKDAKKLYKKSKTAKKRGGSKTEKMEGGEGVVIEDAKTKGGSSPLELKGGEGDEVDTTPTHLTSNGGSKKHRTKRA